jgi:dynein heavy chain
MFHYKGGIFIYGGWNYITSFNSTIRYDIAKDEWQNTNLIDESFFVWNHCGLEVEAVPSWKYFIFGGSTGVFDETKMRERQKCHSGIYVGDLDTQKIQSVVLDSNLIKPPAVEDSSMIYHKVTKSLVIFGGWNNIWFGDIYSCCVSSIVGPSYSVTSLEPNMGRISGQQRVKIFGSKLLGDNFTVYFISGKYKSQTVESISDSEAIFTTPNFCDLGAKDVEVRISINGEELSTNPINFTIYLDTKADKSVYFGPGTLNGVCPGHKTSFMIRAKNELNENRTSGMDEFTCTIVEIVTMENVPNTITDLKNGLYRVEYTAPKVGRYKISIGLKEDSISQNIRGSPIDVNCDGDDPSNNNLDGPLMINRFLKDNYELIDNQMQKLIEESKTKGKDLTNINTIINIKNSNKTIDNESDRIDCTINQLVEYYKTFELGKNKISKEIPIEKLEGMFKILNQMLEIRESSGNEIAPLIVEQTEKNKTEIQEFSRNLITYGSQIRLREFAQRYDIGPKKAFEEIAKVELDVQEKQAKLDIYDNIMKNLNYPEETIPCHKTLENTRSDMRIIKNMWNFIQETLGLFEEFKNTSWPNINGPAMDEKCGQSLTKKLTAVRKEANSYGTIIECINREINLWKKLIPLISSMKSDCIKDRHWDEIKKIINKKDLKIDKNLNIKLFYELNIHLKNEEIGEITEKAANEEKMQKKIEEVKKNWTSFEYQEKPYARQEGVKLLEMNEDQNAILEDNMQHIQTMSRNRFKAFFEKEIENWKNDLNAINDVSVSLIEVQNTWCFLESLFIGSDEIKKELPKDTERFIQIDKEVKEILKKGSATKNVLKFSTSKFEKKSLFDWLKDILKRLGECEKSLNIFMESKRTVFPRFYFISSVDLLDILSNGNNPLSVNKHINKVILAIDSLEMVENKGDRPSVKAMTTRVGKETVEFYTPCKLIGKVETYLELVLNFMKKSLNSEAKKSCTDYYRLSQAEWIQQTPSQISLLTDLIAFCAMSEEGLVKVSSQPDAVKDCLKKQLTTLTSLIKLVMNDLSVEVMAKVMVLIKSQTHCRDVIEKLIQEKVSRIDEFQWQSQLKAYWNKEKSDSHLNVCDAEFWYGYEYLGNGDRLVVTPLTDRIYVTATQALHLKMGCAPAGPAGTGKTETTKDLASALGKACYVFNCSDQMDYKGMGEIFRGTASSGSWACFDEFNRLVPEVLSVCSMQFKSITDALKRKDKIFKMEDKVCDLDPTCGAFITMNPGYLGRSELPEGLKVLFRPITVVVPDFEMISENCLMAQGYIDAKILARKFVVLYSLCKNLLSQQSHYDWGLRAIKSVLVVAGGFKRADPDSVELKLLKRALRDFNIPKIVKDDLDVFHGLISDLFPNCEVERKRDMNFETRILDACLVVNELAKGKGIIEEDTIPPFRLTSMDEFVLKVVQLRELIEIRHSVFVMGNAGSGKTSTWKTLAKTFDLCGTKTECKDLNPKSITSDDLYGKYINIQTRDFKYGILSNIMKNMSTSHEKKQSWIILDGDLDANWIENMNSVMDDNKVLTLPNNDRIDLTPSMRLFFEIRDLKYATPATVSRAGILYISDEDGYQWKAFVKSWIQQMRFRKLIEKETVDLFTKFLDPVLRQLKNSKFIVAQVFSITFVVALCKLLESYIDRKEACIASDPKKNIKNEDDPYVGYDYIFMFCTIWACGAILTEKDGTDFKRTFSDWFRTEYKDYKFPNKGTVFDYFIFFDPETKLPRLEEWNKKIPDIEYKPADNIKFVTVPTSETISVSEIMEKLLEVNHPSLLIGMAGCGKTQLCKGMLESTKRKAEIQKSSFSYVIVNFNYYSDTYSMQNVLIQNTEKFSQRTFVPKGNPKMMAIFIDDINMQMLDKCNTQNAIELTRQFADYKHIYECSKMELMEFMNIQFIASMNPTAGSFNINPRLQRHFWICSIPFPTDASLINIYSFFLNGHFRTFSQAITEFIQNRSLVTAILQVHQKVSAKFKKSAVNFHYEFNIRHITGVFQGVLMSSTEKFKEPEKVVKLWIHECERIYGDRLVTQQDLNTFRIEIGDIVKKNFPKYNLTRYFQEKSNDALIFCRFVNGHLDNVYEIAAKLQDVRDRTNTALSEYNDSNAVMELVLFEDAVKHVCRITRILSQPCGHGLLVGVGGSGKQSLSKLSSFICQYNITMITISQEYKITQFKEDLQKMYNNTGNSEESGYLFIFTEGQIVDEKFMVPINDLLSSGEVQDLFNNDDKEVIINKLRNSCKGATGKDSPADVWNFFIARVKKNLHMSICFSPGDNLRSKARKFPAIVNSTVIDWFQPWPEEALYSVCKEKLSKELEELTEKEYFDSVVKFMPSSFRTTGDKAGLMLEIDRRFTYVTPKSFLEHLKLFSAMFTSKLQVILVNKNKLDLGLQKLFEAKDKIERLEKELEVKTVEINQIKTIAEEKDRVAKEQAEIVGKEAAIAEAEEKKVSIQAKNIEEESAKCENELNNLKPLMETALKLAAGLEKKDLDAVKAIKPSPPAIILQVLEAILIMVAGQIDGFIKIEVDKKFMPKKMEKTDKVALLNDATVLKKAFDEFLEMIKVFKVNEKNFENLIAKHPDFFKDEKFEENKVRVAQASPVVGNLYQWLYYMFKFYYSAKTVEPMQKLVDTKKGELQEAMDSLNIVKEKVAELNANLEEVLAIKRKAEFELNAALTEEKNCKDKLDLAKRFTNALGSSSERWEQNIIEFEDILANIIGDILIGSAFVSYCGPFPKKYREGIKQSFVDYVVQNNIPYTQNAKDPLNILTNDAEKARWNNQKLPADPVSIENGAILSNSERWPLLVDPQLQGIKWIKEKEKDNGLIITRMNNKNLINKLGEAIEDGKTFMIENLDEMIDATLGPVIARNSKKKGMARVFQLGNSEFVINSKFKFILHTKLSNPHYPPEIQAETVMINFTVTEDGLEDQLLALIVKMERPKLAKRKEEVIQEQNECKIQLRDLEDTILKDLNTPGDLLENIPLIGRLENSKVVSEVVNNKVRISKEAEIEINDSSNFYRPSAARGALIFFLMTELYKLHSFYLYSLESYIFVIRRSVNNVSEKWKNKLKAAADNEGEQAEGENEEKGEENKEEEIEEEMPDNVRFQRVQDLVTAITEFSYYYVKRGLFERHKLIFATLLTFRILLKDGKIKPEEMQYLIEGKKEKDIGELVAALAGSGYLKEFQIASVKGLEGLSYFANLWDSLNSPSEITYWRKWLKDEKAETSDLPKSYVGASPFQKLLIIRALRPDRITYAITNYINETMGEKYIEPLNFSMNETYKETNNLTPIFFVLFPGEDPTLKVEEQGKLCGKTIKDGTFINIPMGQGQEEGANRSLVECAEKGKWIMLQNVHLMITWMKKFENDLEAVSANAHPDFRCFISSEPPPLPEMKIIPEPILQASVKVANEAPQDLKANLRRAYLNFNNQRLESCSKVQEFKSILFGLCFFHALVIGRKKFGAIGWSRVYNFNEGDLTICADVLNNYLEKYEKVPYEDIRYIFGEIMYGGHITDGWDRRTNSSYLKVLIKPELLLGSNLAPNFKSPDPVRYDYDAYKKYIDEKLPQESPVLFYLHSNAEISYLTAQGEFMFDSIFNVQGGSVVAAVGKKKDDLQENIKAFTDKLLLCANFKLADIKAKVPVLGPYDVVAVQECERINIINSSLLKTLEELTKGINGELNITDAMEDLSKSIRYNKLPDVWSNVSGYPSKKSLNFWFEDLIRRWEQLSEWTKELILPKAVNITLLCAPMSFVTAIKQVTARAQGFSLDDLETMTEVTNITEDEFIKDPPTNGVLVYGMFIQGARWEDPGSEVPGFLAEMTPKELDPKIPYMNIFAVKGCDRNTLGYYECPVYYTTARGATYIFTAFLKMESEYSDPNKWVLAGVALILSSDD